MIHYHGTPISGRSVEHADFYTGRHALVSWPNPGAIGDVAEFCQSFVMDNGAFIHKGKNIEPKWSDFYLWVDEWRRHPGFDWALIPDVIDGSEEENDHLIDEWPFDHQGVPVWHLDESIEKLVRLANEWPRVALGSSGEYWSVGSKDWWARLGYALGHIVDDLGRPITKLHGLRMLDPKVFTKLPLSSADSTNAGVNAGSKSRFGQYVPAKAGLRAVVIADRIEMHNSAPVWGLED